MQDRREQVIRVPVGAASRTDSLLAAIDEKTALVAVSHVLSADGERTDLVRLRAAADSGGAPMLGDRLRVGFHYFNNHDDVAAALTALHG